MMSSAAGETDSGRSTPRGDATACTVVIAITTLVALLLRVYWLTRPGMLLGSPEYDDGVYLGSAIRLLDGVLPYRDFVFVHPPGITLVMVPLAALGKATSSATAMAAARILTVAVGAAAIVLCGMLVRHRGLLATTIACSLLAVQQASIRSSSTPFQEPWLVLFCLIGAVAVFDGDRSTERRRRLIGGGAAVGVAVTIKLFALIPAGMLLLVVLAGRRWRRAASYVGGALAAAVVLVVPFFLAAPHAFLRDVLVTQLDRTDTVRIPAADRLGPMLGLDVISLSSRQVVVIALITAVLVLACLAAGGVRSRALLPPLDFFAVATTVLIAAAFLLPPQFFPHYAAFFAPFLALTVGLSVQHLLVGRRAPGARLDGPTRWIAVVIGTVAVAWSGVLVWRDLHLEASLAAPRPAPVLEATVPSGDCVVTDDPSLTVVSNRFRSSVPGCTKMVDGFGTDLALGHGNNGLTGAGRYASVERAWLDAFAHAQYVILTCAPPAAHACDGFANRRIPWTPSILGYFNAHFRPVPGVAAILYSRVAG